MISPGLELIGKAVGRLLLPCSITYSLSVLLCKSANFVIPRRYLAGLTTAVVLLYKVSETFLDDVRNGRQAKAHGAVLPKRVQGSRRTLTKAIIQSFQTGYPLEIFSTWADEYGSTYRFTAGVEERVFTTEPEHVKALLATQFESFIKGPLIAFQLRSLLGTGVFNSDGDMWKFHRAITRPFFSRERVSDFDVFDRHAEDAIRQAKLRLAEGYPIDFQDLVSRFTLDSATEFLFNNDVHSLGAGLPYPSHPSTLARANPAAFDSHPSNKFVKAFTIGQNITAGRSLSGWLWPLKEVWGDAVLPYRRAVDQFVEPFLDKGLQRMGEKRTDLGVGGTETLLDHLLQQTSDRDIIKDELVNLLVASRDTTASLLTFSLYMLIEHPGVTRRLREEIVSKVGLTNCPTYDNIRDMRYLRAFLNEVLRLYPPVHVNSRTSAKPVVLSPPTGTDTPIYLPAGIRVQYSVFLMHRRTDLWGPDALTFDPDRFLDERLHKYLVHNPFIFTPFNAGPRICLGQQFAYNETSFFLIRLLQRFSSFSMAPDAQPPETLPPAEWKNHRGTQGTDRVCPGTHLTMYVKGGLWVRMHEAGETDVS